MRGVWREKREYLVIDDSKEGNTILIHDDVEKILFLKGMIYFIKNYKSLN